MSLETVLQLRKEDKLEEALQVMKNLLEQEPSNATYQYQMAWCNDALGHEKAAVPYYKRAIELGLPPEQLKGAYLGLGSTYRTLGQYEESRDVLSDGIQAFPHNNELKVFFAMTLYNLGEHNEAMQHLLHVITHTTNDEEVLKYKRAIDFYKDRLDEVWDQ